MEPAIKIENLSKQYRLGAIGSGTLAQDLNKWWFKLRGLEDPYSTIGEINDRSKKGTSEYVWALKDINFEVMPGEVLGIIGANGAGKSTLLKLLSRVTAPTEGRIIANGRIASLLEVGTGFHPELTGKENVFLNGAIMGMTKAEIRSKFDEIVDFAGCERYIDTPVKRYSSGMYVRLAFAVAAHLEPEILIVDEVLAVGDAEFQKKAIGKMQDVSRSDGRTVLFVSHNMASLQQLCTKAIILKNGQMIFEGTTGDAIEEYLKFSRKQINNNLIERTDRSGQGLVKFKDYEIKKTDSNLRIVNLMSGDDVTFEFSFTGYKNLERANITLKFMDEENNVKFLCNNMYSSKFFPYLSSKNIVKCRVPNFPLCPGKYYAHLRCWANYTIQDDIEYAFEFEVENGDFHNNGNFQGTKEGVLVDHSWEII